MKHSINPCVHQLLTPWLGHNLRFALVRYGGGIVQMSGSIAGDTFARNRYGNYVRARTKPTNPNTHDQVKVRSAVAYLTELWSDELNAAQRTAWGVYGSNVAMKNKLGETIKLTGFNHFIRSNVVRAQQEVAIIEDGPVVFELPAKDETITIDVDDTPQQISVDWDHTRDWATETGAFLHMRQGLPQNGQRNFFGGPYHNLGIVHGSVPAYTPPLLIAPHYAVAATQRQWMAFRIYRVDGRVSEIFYADALTHSQAIGEVPELIGMSQAAAEAKLTSPEVQLIVGTVTEENDPVIPVGHVISSDPVAHTRLEAGDPVNLVISLGPTA
ncbi:hypothetical protein ES703_26306 [subsurface metagenome]